MFKMGNEIAENQQVRAVPQNELALAALRDEALLALVKQNKETTFDSSVTNTPNGLQIDTTDQTDKSKSQMVIKGTSEYSPPLHGWHLDTQWNGDYTITHNKGGERRVEKDSFRYVGGMFDDFMSREDKSNVTMTRKDANGNPFQTYLPAISETVMQDGRLAYAPNGQPLRHARLAGSETNCGLTMSNSRGGDMECNYIIKDARFGKDISYNETREKNPSGYHYRSVVRDTQGGVLGIINQTYSVNRLTGDVTSVTTSGRKPDMRPR